ncbi:MAG TPA: substrate-binding domain-containing protein [Polyangia bacterium]
MIPEPLVCHVAAAREAAGETQAGLARKLGVSRQALSLVESGRSVPSTALALKLARALGKPVDELFVLRNESARPREISVIWAESETGQAETAITGRVLVGRIGRRLVGHPMRGTDLTAADGFATGGRTPRRVQLMRAAEGLGEGPAVNARWPERLFVAGCAPALGLLCDHLEKSATPVRASWIHATTDRALAALSRKEVQVAGQHFPPGRATAVKPARHRATTTLTLATWRQGLLVRRGDRSAPRNVAQLGARGVRVARREAGASANRLLDAALGAAGIAKNVLPALIVRGHFGVGAAVALGAADVGVAAEHAAIAHDLDFVPLDEERFDLTFDAAFVHDPRYQRMGDLLASRAFRTELQNLGGYDTTTTGSVPAKGANP